MNIIQIVNKTFDYLSIESGLRVAVTDHAEAIKGLMKRSATGILDIGKRLLAVKEILPHGKFGEWIEAEFEMSERSAQNFMKVATVFKNATVADLSPKVLYLLASDSTPEDARQEALDRAASGEKITHAEAKKIVADKQPAHTPDYAGGNLADPPADELDGVEKETLAEAAEIKKRNKKVVNFPSRYESMPAREIVNEAIVILTQVKKPERKNAFVELRRWIDGESDPRPRRSNRNELVTKADRLYEISLMRFAMIPISEFKSLCLDIKTGIHAWLDGGVQ